MAIDDGHGPPVVANASAEMLEAPVCLAQHEVAGELALQDLHAIGLHDRRVVSVDKHTDRWSRS
eukprot:138495-Pyramimonas_sp.AAC.1